MKATRPNTRDSLARNLDLLMKLRGWDQPELKRRSGVAQKTISNMLNKKVSAQLDNIGKVAGSFNLDAWHLLLPNLPHDLVSGGEIERLYQSFIHSDAEGREYILHVSEREASYRSSSNDST